MSVVDSPDETKFIYYVDEEDTPYLVKLNIAPEQVTLGDFKNALNRPHFKFFFKSLDDDFGVVKEEILDDNAILPCFNGRVISWLVTADGSSTSDYSANLADSQLDGANRARQKNPPGVSDDMSDHRSARNNNNLNVSCKLAGTVSADSTSSFAPVVTSTSTLKSALPDPDTESLHSLNQDRIAPLRNFQNYKSSNRHGVASSHHHYHHDDKGSHGLVSADSAAVRHRSRHHHHPETTANGGSSSWRTYETAPSMLSSDLESSSFVDSEDESSRFSSITGTTLSSRPFNRLRQRRRRRRRPPPPITRASSFSSMTDSTMSLNIVSVTLDMDTVNFLGISIVGQSNKAGDGGIYVGSIMKGGAVAQDGRIEPGDMILEVNGISFEEMSNDDAVRTLREQVKHPGPITLVVAKCWEPNNHGGFFTLPRQEPVRPIDPRAWVLQTNAMTNGKTNPIACASSAGGGSSSTLSPSGCDDGGGGGADLTPGMSMGTLTSGQTSMPLGTSAAAYNMAASLLAAAASKQRQHQLANMNQQQLDQSQLQQQAHHHFTMQNFPQLMVPTGPSGQPLAFHQHPQQQRQMAAASAVTGSNSMPDIEDYSESRPLTVTSDMAAVVRVMIQPDSGLEIRDRTWLKLTIPNAVIGSDLVDWLYRHVEGFPDRRSTRQYASSLLKSGYIRHTVNKTTFSEQCYYIFRDITDRLSCISLEEVDSVSEVGSPQTWVHAAAARQVPINVGSQPPAIPQYQHSRPNHILPALVGTSDGVVVNNGGSQDPHHRLASAGTNNTGVGSLQIPHLYNANFVPKPSTNGGHAQLLCCDVQDTAVGGEAPCRIISSQPAASGGYSTASSSSADTDVVPHHHHNHHCDLRSACPTSLAPTQYCAISPAPALRCGVDSSVSRQTHQLLKLPDTADITGNSSLSIPPQSAAIGNGNGTTDCGSSSSGSSNSGSSYTSGVLVPGASKDDYPPPPPPPPPRTSTLLTRS